MGGESLEQSLQRLAKGHTRVPGCVQAHYVYSRFRHVNPPIKQEAREKEFLPTTYRRLFSGADA